ncbi:hypothetical protein RHMOL_Rhmol06G0145600 [Rhododendron molle]|uniref:Uncharacterized protein n=1 Tax=Rhododendron molle TaxID=49168 RepID=A0ACC0NCX7_RHOML|nr:hypothetical protein RHMOL_Rhmol06G0145600 [Rhododendron molle]
MAMGTGRGRWVLPPPPTHYLLPHLHPRSPTGIFFFLHPRPKRRTGIQNGDSGNCISQF